MSVVAWDGKTLAADRQFTGGNVRRAGRKLHRVRDALVGVVGCMDAAEELLAWYQGALNPDRFPEAQRTNNDAATLLAVCPDGSLKLYCSTPYPVRYTEGQTLAIGSGSDFALAAMHCGKTAAEAVEVACHFDVSCGCGVDTLTFEKENDGTVLSVREARMTMNTDEYASFFGQKERA